MEGDLETAHRYGQRIAEITTMRLRGVSSSNLVADGNEMSLAREIPSWTDGASP